jgi:hypothetical protein
MRSLRVLTVLLALVLGGYAALAAVVPAKDYKLTPVSGHFHLEIKNTTGGPQNTFYIVFANEGPVVDKVLAFGPGAPATYTIEKMSGTNFKITFGTALPANAFLMVAIKGTSVTVQGVYGFNIK